MVILEESLKLSNELVPNKDAENHEYDQNNDVSPQNNASPDVNQELLKNDQTKPSRKNRFCKEIIRMSIRSLIALGTFFVAIGVSDFF